MADTNPNMAPGAKVVVDDDGKVTAHGRRAWIWCTDEGTGARFDVPASRLPKTGVTPVPGYEVNFSKFGRDPKAAADLAGDPAEPKTTAKPAAGKKENTQ